MHVLLLSPLSEVAVNRDLMYGCWCLGKRVANIVVPNVSLASIGAYLQCRGHMVRVVDENAAGPVPGGIPWSEFDLVVVLSNTTTFISDARRLAQVKASSDRTKTVMCGQHVTALPESIAAWPVDFAIRGEPEPVLGALCERLETKEGFSDVPGLVSRNDDGTLEVPAAPRPTCDLDSYPLPDRSLLPRGHYFHPLARSKPFTSVMASRGCKGACIFCTSPAFYGRTYRQRSCENVLAELALIQTQGYREVLFRDETLSADVDRLRRICDGMLSRGIRLTWMCNVVCGAVDASDLRLMKRAGCHTVMFGVESGDPGILRRIHKPTNLKAIEETTRASQALGLATHVHMLVGNPGETRETVRSSMQLLKRLKPTTADIGVVVPFPGSELYAQLLKEDPAVGDATGLSQEDTHLRSFHMESLCSLGPDELSAAVREMYRLVYGSPATWWQNIRACTTPVAASNRLRSAISLGLLLLASNRDQG